MVKVNNFNVFHEGNHSSLGDPHPQYINKTKAHLLGSAQNANDYVPIGTINIRYSDWNFGDAIGGFNAYYMLHIFSDPNYSTSTSTIDDTYSINVSVKKDLTFQNIFINKHTPVTTYGRLIVDLTQADATGIKATIYYNLELNKNCYLNVLKDFPYGRIGYKPANIPETLTINDYVSGAQYTAVTSFTNPFYETVRSGNNLKFDTNPSAVANAINAIGANAVMKIAEFNLPTAYYSALLDIATMNTTAGNTVKIYGKIDGSNNLSLNGKNSKIYGTMDVLYLFDSVNYKISIYVPAIGNIIYLFHVSNVYTTGSIKIIKQYELVNNIFDKTTLTGIQTMSY